MEPKNKGKTLGYKYPHIHCVVVDWSFAKKTNRYTVMGYDKELKKYNTFLGEVKWKPTWRMYCFYPIDESFWSSSCLKNMVEFLELINKEHKEKKSHTLAP